MRRAPGQIASERLLPIATHERDRRVGLRGRLVVPVRGLSKALGERLPAIIESPWIVVHMAAIETLEGLKPPSAPSGWHEAWLGVAVQMPLPDIVSGVSGLSEGLRPADLRWRQLQIVANHAGLVRMPTGEDARPVRTADRIRGVGAAPVRSLGGEFIEVRRPHHLVRPEPEGA